MKHTLYDTSDDELYNTCNMSDVELIIHNQNALIDADPIMEAAFNAAVNKQRNKLIQPRVKPDTQNNSKGMQIHEFVHDAKPLRDAIAANPNLPIVIVANDESCIGDGVNTYQNDMSVSVTEILTCTTPFDIDRDEFYQVFDDRVEFEEALYNYLADIHEDYTDEQLSDLLADDLKEYEPYWKKVIYVQVSN